MTMRSHLRSSLFQLKDEPEGSEGYAKRVSFRVLNSTQLSSWFRGGGNVGIAPHDLHFLLLCWSDFQGLWEGRKTALSFSGLSINRHFHGLPRSPRNSQAATFTVASIQSFSNCIGLAQCSVECPPRRMFGYTRAARRWFHPWLGGRFENAAHAAVPLSVNQTASRCTRCPSSFPCGSLKA